MAPTPRDPEAYSVREKEVRVVIAAGAPETAGGPIRGKDTTAIYYDDNQRNDNTYCITNCNDSNAVVDPQIFERGYDPKDKRRMFRKFINQKKRK